VISILLHCDGLGLVS